jgi:hypothetical protein
MFLYFPDTPRTFFGQTQFRLQIHKECFDVHTVGSVQFIIQTNKCTNIYIYIYIYINNILCTVSTPTCFDASSSSSGSLNLVLAEVTGVLKVQLSKYCNVLIYCFYCVVILIIVTIL